MMNTRQWLKFGGLLILMAGAFAIYQRAQAQQQTQSKSSSQQEVQAQKGDLPQHNAAPGDGKNMVLQLCDGETNLTLQGVRPDERLSPQQAQAASNQLMKMWYAKADPATAMAWQKEAAAAQKKTTGQKAGGTSPAGQNQQPNDFTSRDFTTWKRELDREVNYGDQIFHSDKLIDSANGVACAMCHPHASNTHPETYPKFQIQLRRVSLLRDMINWCIENPCRGKTLAADDPKMRALEAYIMAQRKGVAMEYGKH